MDDSPPVLLRDFLLDHEVIYPEREIGLPSCLVYSNMERFNPRMAAHLANEAYVARTARCDAVVFGRLPDRSTLIWLDYVLCVDGAIVLDSVSSAIHTAKAHLQSVMEDARERPCATVDFNEECVLLARRGWGTWGHWAGEMLPIAAAIEERFPGKFRYAIPQHGHIDFVCAALHSLDYYGISSKRIVWLPNDCHLRLTRAWTLTPIWSDLSPHPSALETLRRRMQPTNGYERVALMRRDWHSRHIANAAAVEDLLRTEGFHITDVAGMRFPDQVRLFQNAKIVFGVLGSGLSGLVYAPDGVSVIAAGPAGWQDRFFYTIAQHRRGRWADVKGPSVNEVDAFQGPFTVPTEALHEALAAVTELASS